MTLYNLKEELVKHGTVAVLKEGVVFSVLIIGKGLDKANVVNVINAAVLDYAGDKYPILEAMRNDETYYLLILRPKL